MGLCLRSLMIHFFLSWSNKGKEESQMSGARIVHSELEGAYDMGPKRFALCLRLRGDCQSPNRIWIRDAAHVSNGPRSRGDIFQHGCF